MGRYSGTRTRIEYDRYVIVDDAIHLENATAVEGTLVHYELEEGEGRSLANDRPDPSERVHSLATRKMALIESIRSEARRVLDDRDVERIDRRAERLLDGIDGGLDRADAQTRAQYERALDRMIAAEEAPRWRPKAGSNPFDESRGPRSTSG